MKKKRIISLALAAALILALGTAAYAIYNWRLQDLVLHSSTENETEISESQSFDPLPAGVDTISLQGYAGSPEYKAMLEWSEFQKNYDRDGEILKAVGNNPTPWDEKYSPAYGVYSQEMADTIDEIASKYGLTLHSGFAPASIDELRGSFGDFGLHSWDGYGYCYSDGTFQCDCDNGKVMFQIRRCMKGVLDTVSLNISNTGQYEQWEYTTSCGKTVLLALAPRHGLILSESEQSFTVVTAGIMAGTDSDFTAELLEDLADSINFSVL